MNNVEAAGKRTRAVTAQLPSPTLCLCPVCIVLPSSAEARHSADLQHTERSGAGRRSRAGLGCEWRSPCGCGRTNSDLRRSGTTSWCGSLCQKRILYVGLVWRWIEGLGSRTSRPTDIRLVPRRVEGSRESKAIERLGRCQEGWGGGSLEAVVACTILEDLGAPQTRNLTLVIS